MDDPIGLEQYLALNAYLCFCSAWGAFTGAFYAFNIVRHYIDELFYLGIGFTIFGGLLLALSELKAPTLIFRWVITRPRA